MKRIRQSFSLFLSLCLLLALLPTGVRAADSGSCGDNLTWTLDSDTLTISGTGEMENWAYSSHAPWYDSRNDIQTVQIESGVTSIGNYAFEGCSALTGVAIPDSVSSMGAYAFSGCSSLTSVTIPEWMNRFGYGAFSDCSALTSIIIPNGVTSIGAAMFRNCSKLASVTISNSVTSIGDDAFNACSALTSVDIPSSVTRMGQSAFESCSALKRVTIPERVTSIESSTFLNCSALTGVTIPDGVTSIGMTAFQNCSSLKRVTIPDGVASIGDGAFQGCTALTGVDIPNSVTSIGISAFRDCSALTGVDIPNGVTSIGGSAFEGCSSLTSVTIPDSVTSIGEFAFSGCSNLKRTTIPNSVTSIGIQAFCGCSNLTSVTISNGVTSIGEFAFFGCSGLTSVTIPDSVTSIGSSVFEGCSSLTSMTISDGLSRIGKSAFWNCSGLKRVTIPDGVTSIGEFAFWNCSGLTSVTIPDSVTSVEERAFSACNNLKDVYYSGSKDQWKQITISTGNEPLTSANIHYDYDPNATYYTITFDTRGGSAVASQSVNAGGTVERPASPTRSGYTFTGWFKESACTNVWNFDSDTVSGNTTLYAGWEQNAPDSYTVTFDTAGSSAVASQTVKAGGKVQKPATPTWKGHTFIGWFKDSACKTPWNFDTDTVNRDTTLYAGWKQDPLPEGAASGPCGADGSDVNWELAGGVLTISGTGEMADWNNAFKAPWYAKCNEIRTVRIESGVTNIGRYAFFSCKNLTSVTIPDGVADIGDYAFIWCSKLTEVTIPESVTGIGGWAFYSCSKLAHAAMPDSVTEIGNSAFFDCGALEEIAIPSGLTRIEQSVFRWCRKLASVTIPEHVTAIDEDAFAYCEKLKRVAIPAAVKEIGTGAFRECNNLRNVDYSGSRQQWNGISIGEENRPLTAATLHCAPSSKPDAPHKTADFAYQFTNSRTEFGYDDAFRIPVERYQLVYGKTAKAGALYKMKKRWTGNCFGMVGSSGLLFQDKNALSAFSSGATHPGALKLSDENAKWQLSLKEFIESIQIAQYDARVQDSYRKYKNNLTAIRDAALNFQTVGSNPPLIALFGPEGNHALLCYGIDEKNSRLLVYDCDFPTEQRYISLIKSSSGRYTGWSYDAGNVHWGSGSDETWITCVPYSTYSAVWEGRGGQRKKANTVLLYLNSQDFEILDAEGTAVATVRNGVVESKMDQIYQVFDAGLSREEAEASGETVLYMPVDVYTVTNKDDSHEKLEATMVHVDHAVTVSTSGDAVMLGVNDKSDASYVEVTGTGAAYAITLDSSETIGTNAREVQLTGTVSAGKESVSLAKRSETLYATGVDVEASGTELTVKGETAEDGDILQEMPEDFTEMVADISASVGDAGSTEATVSNRLRTLAIQCPTIYAVSYNSNGKMTKITKGRLSGNTITFSKPVKPGDVLFFPDASYAPVCEKVILSEQ